MLAVRRAGGDCRLGFWAWCGHLMVEYGMRDRCSRMARRPRGRDFDSGSGDAPPWLLMCVSSLVSFHLPSLIFMIVLLVCKGW